MGKGHRTCEVCGVKERHSDESLLFSQFPLDQDRCRMWLAAVGNEELLQLPIEKLHESRHVCGRHFQKQNFNKKGNRLKRNAVPTRNLLAPPLTDIQLAEFPQHKWTDNKKESAASTSRQKENVLDDLHVVDPSLPSTSRTERNVFTELSSNVLTNTSNKRSSESFENKEKRRKRSELQESSTLARAPAVTPSASQRDTPIHVKTQIELTPKKKKLMEQLQKTRCNLVALKKSANLIEKLESTVLREIVTSAIKNQKRKPKGRRWTTSNKISALAIFKRSPKAYRYLNHLMPLPSVKTLHNVLKKIPMQPGINKAVIDHLRKVATKKSRMDKYCGLVFDEIALKRRLIYEEATDKVEGFEDLGLGDSGRSLRLADHALVFMLQGIRAKFKQPIAFYFVKGTVSSQRLASLIKEIICTVEETGFKILTTICDQGPTNMGALKLLKSLSSSKYNQNCFDCANREIYIMYDVPHLFKSIRNNFMNYGELHMCGMKAKWAHLINVEEKNRQLLYLSKITPMHVNPKYRAKMKVKYAAQVLSNTVSAVLKLSAEAERDPIRAEELMQTGIIVHDLDCLFDKTNGPSCPDDIKKGRRENVSEKTDHMEVWAEYLKKIKTITFKKSDGTTAKNVRCVEGFITSLHSLRDLWHEVRKIGFKYLNLRQLNQDALENLFGVIRQHSPTNRNPTCSSFMAALKTTIISGMTAPHNRGSNCEKDFQKLLTDFRDHVFDDSISQTEQIGNEKEAIIQHEHSHTVDSNPEIPCLSIPEEIEEIESDLAAMEQQPLVYVSGYIASCIFKKHDCKHCANILKVEHPNDDDSIFSYIRLREWWKNKKSLTYPSKELCRLIEKAIQIFENEVAPNIHYLNICKFTVTLFMAKCDDSFFTCNDHHNQIINVIYRRLSLLLIRRQCQRENQKLSLEEESLADASKKAQQLGTAK